MNKTIIVLVLGLAVVGGGSFYAGMLYGKNSNTQSARGGMRFQQNGGAAAGGARFGRNGGGFTGGEIISKDDKSVTIKLQNGGSQIVFFSASTSVMKSVSGSAGDLEAGETISVNGSANSDGSIAADTIQLRTGAPKQ